MSFFIKSFKITPQALDIKNANPDHIEYCMGTDVVCLTHFGNDKFKFIYKVGSRTVASTEKKCGLLDRAHEIHDEIKVISNRWGNGVESLVNISVSVTQESIGSKNTFRTVTWVKE